MPDPFKDFDSPFFDPKLRMLEPDQESHGDPARILRESMFERFSIQIEDTNLVELEESELFENAPAFNIKSDHLEIVGESGISGLDQFEDEDGERWNEVEVDSDGAEELEALTGEEDHGEIPSDEVSVHEECPPETTDRLRRN